MTVLLLIAVAGCSAQTVRGTVLDSAGAAIPGAEVTVQSSAKVVSTRTDSAGSFAVSGMAPPATVSVRAEGFATAASQWNGSDPVTLTVHPPQVQEQVVVTATRTAAPLGEVSSSVSRISAAELDAAPQMQLDDVLRQVPGFSLFRRTSSRTANPTSQGVSLRGLGASGASRALVLFHGVPLNDPFGGWVYWDRVPLTDIGSLEVLRGGASALYGSGALAGVIDVDRRDLRDRSASIDLSGGDQSTANGSATVTDRFGQWGVGASAQALRTDGYIPVPANLRGAIDAPANVRFGTGRMIVDRQFSAGTVFVTGNLFDESRQNGTVLQVNSSRLAEGTLGADLGAGGGTISLRSYISGQHFYQTFSSIAADRNSEALTRVQNVPAQQFGFSALWSRPLGSSNTFTVGADVRRVTGHSSEVLWSRGASTGTVDAGGRQLYFGAFLEDMVRLGSRLHVTAATRVDTWRNYDALSRSLTFASGASSTTPYADRSKAAFSPSLGAVLQVTRLVSLTGSAYGSFRTPTLNELYRAFRLGNVLTLANDSLHPERLRGVEGGVTVGSAPLFARATYFWNTIHDAVGNRTISTTPALITRQRQNIGDIVAHGIELEVQARLPMRLWTRTAYEFSNSIVSRSLEASLLDLRVPQVPRHAVSQTMGYEGRRWSGSVSGRYIGRQFEDDLNQFVLPGYFTVDAMFRARLANGIEPFAACENLLDRGYMIGRTPTPTLGSPRLLRAGLRLRFGGDRASRQ